MFFGIKQTEDEDKTEKREKKKKNGERKGSGNSHNQQSWLTQCWNF